MTTMLSKGQHSGTGGRRGLRYRQRPTQGKAGRADGRALALVMEWYNLHRGELLEDWKLAQQRRPLRPIDPLE